MWRVRASAAASNSSNNPNHHLILLKTPILPLANQAHSIRLKNPIKTSTINNRISVISSTDCSFHSRAILSSKATPNNSADSTIPHTQPSPHVRIVNPAIPSSHLDTADIHDSLQGKPKSRLEQLRAVQAAVATQNSHSEGPEKAQNQQKPVQSSQATPSAALDAQEAEHSRILAAQQQRIADAQAAREAFEQRAAAEKLAKQREEETKSKKIEQEHAEKVAQLRAEQEKRAEEQRRVENERRAAEIAHSKRMAEQQTLLSERAAAEKARVEGEYQASLRAEGLRRAEEAKSPEQKAQEAAEKRQNEEIQRENQRKSAEDARAAALRAAEVEQQRVEKENLANLLFQQQLAEQRTKSKEREVAEEARKRQEIEEKQRESAANAAKQREEQEKREKQRLAALDKEKQRLSLLEQAAIQAKTSAPASSQAPPHPEATETRDKNEALSTVKSVASAAGSVAGAAVGKLSAAAGGSGNISGTSSEINDSGTKRWRWLLALPLFAAFLYAADKILRKEQENGEISEKSQQKLEKYVQKPRQYEEKPTESTESTEIAGKQGNQRVSGLEKALQQPRRVVSAPGPVPSRPEIGSVPIYNSVELEFLQTKELQGALEQLEALQMSEKLSQLQLIHNSDIIWAKNQTERAFERRLRDFEQKIEDMTSKITANLEREGDRVGEFDSIEAAREKLLELQQKLANLQENQQKLGENSKNEAEERVERELTRAFNLLLAQHEQFYRDLLQYKGKTYDSELSYALSAQKRAIIERNLAELERKATADYSLVLSTQLQKQESLLRALMENFLWLQGQQFQQNSLEQRETRLANLANLQKQVANFANIFAAQSNYAQETQRLHLLNASLLSLGDLTQKMTKFPAEFRILYQLSSEDAIIKVALESIPQRLVEQGIPSVEYLVSRFSAVEKACRRAIFVPNQAQNSIWGQFLANFFAFLTVSETKLPSPGTDSNSKLSRAAHFVGRKDISSAKLELEELPREVREFAEDWLSEARDRLVVQQALQTIRTRITVLSLSHT
jgi:hypothetical protein